MADIELIIKIDEETYKNIQFMKNVIWANGIYRAIHNGIPLPKGHGRILDEKDILDTENNDGGWYDLTDMPEYIAGVKPIIEADNEEEGKMELNEQWLKEFKMFDKDEEVLDRMTIDDYIKILKLWLYKGTNGLTNTELGYMEGWFHKIDKEAFEAAIEIMCKYQKMQEILEKVWNIPSCMIDKAECLDKIMETYRTVRRQNE